MAKTRWLPLATWLVVVAGSLTGLLRPGAWLPRQEVTLGPPFSHEEGFAFAATVPFRLRRFDSREMPFRSELRLFEDGRELGPSASARMDIQQVGRGAYTHVGRRVRFSTSDNSDPNVNGRRYVVSYPVAVPAILVVLAYLAATAIIVGAGLAVRWNTRRILGGRGTSPRFMVGESLLVLFGLTVAAFAYPQVEILTTREGNAIAHLRFAEEIAETGVLYPAHFLYHLLVIAVHPFIPSSDWIYSGMVAVFLLYLLLAVVLWDLFRRALGGFAEGQDPYLLPLMAGSLMIVAPITVLTWHLRNLYYGYMVSHQLWAQSAIALKPFALLTLALGVRVFHPTSPDRRPMTITALAVAALMSTVAKPSFIVCFLPALGLLLIPRLWARRWVDLAVYVGALAIPNLALLVWQYVTTYLAVQHLSVGQVMSGQGTGIALAPLQVMGYLTEFLHPGLWWLLPKFVLSILFPSLVTLLYRERAIHDWRLTLAWLTFGFGCFSAYFLAEVEVPTSGNFVWSGQIATFLLFVTAALFFVEQVMPPGRPTWRALVFDGRSSACTTALALHVICGLYHLAHPLSL